MTSRVIALHLGDRTYNVPMAPIKRAKEWRKKLRKPLNDILGLISSGMELSIESVNDLVGLADKVLPVLLDSSETLFELLLEYAPALRAERGWLEENAYDDQVVDGFLAVLKVAFPLARLTELLGSTSQETSPNSPSPSGE